MFTVVSNFKISSGSYDLNKWLYGGYEKGVITTLFGGAGSGKTNFCLLAAVSQARKGNKVIFIDTEGGFSVERVKQLLESRSSNGKDDKVQDVDSVLKNIFLLKPTNFKEQKEAFGQMLKFLKNEVSLIVIDGMTMLYRLEFADARQKDIGHIQEVNADLTRQLRILAEISRKNDLAVLVTNQVYNWNDEVKMVGGDILKYWSKCLIEVENKNGRRAYLRKHRSLPESSLSFQIYAGGIRKKGWI